MLNNFGKSGRNIIILSGLIVMGLFGWKYLQYSYRLRKINQKAEQVESLIEERKLFKAVLVAIEAAGENLAALSSVEGAGKCCGSLPRVAEPIRRSLLQSFSLLRERQQFPEDTTAYTFSPDGNYFVTSHEDGSLKFWRYDGSTVERVIQTQTNNHKSYIVELVFDPKGRQLLVRNIDNEVQVWNVAGLDLALSESWSLGDFRGRLTVSPDGQIIVAVGGYYGGEIGIWDSKGNNIRPPEQAHWIRITDVAFTPDGQKFITSDTLGRVRHWSRTGQPLNQLEQSSSNSSDPPSIFAVTFPPDGEGKYYLRVNRYALSKIPFAEDSSVDAQSIGDIDELYMRIYQPDSEEAIYRRGIYSLNKQRSYRGSFSPDGKTFVLVYNYWSNRARLAQVWDLYARPVGDPIQERNATINAVSPSGSHVAGRVSFKYRQSKPQYQPRQSQVRLWQTKAPRVYPEFVGGYSLLRDACEYLESHSALKNPITATTKNVVKTCKFYANTDFQSDQD
ncbi:MAG: hypothetical protein AAFY50_12815 [Cyanobacteria bacterium J06648_1]